LGREWNISGWVNSIRYLSNSAIAFAWNLFYLGDAVTS
jgi:hypothetical protein